MELWFDQVVVFHQMEICMLMNRVMELAQCLQH
jgi:hypothetical protein